MSKILIVDDEAFNVDLLMQEVEDLGHETLSACDGIEALSVLEQQDCDLVLLDIMMPNLDGFGVLDRMRDQGQLGRIPVIVISALDGMEHVARCIELGAEDYLLKPFEPTLLEARIKGALAKKLLQDQLAHQLEVTRSIFGQYVSEEIASVILSSKGAVAPVESEASILYCDIVEFTSFIESNAHQDALDCLSEYYTEVISVVAEHEGTVSQFMGDAVLVTFNVPVETENHAGKAIAAAEAISTRVKSNSFSGTQFDVRIGVATGAVIAGNVNAKERLHYSVFGDAVNLAARLEVLNKEYSTSILISERTKELAKTEVNLDFVDNVTVRGQTKQTDVYTLAICSDG